VTMSLSQNQTKMSSKFDIYVKNGLPGPASAGRTDRAVTVPVTVTPAPAESRLRRRAGVTSSLLWSSFFQVLLAMNCPRSDSDGPRAAGRATRARPTRSQ
jgi:hypothetical protein